MDLNLGRPAAFSVMTKPIGSVCNLSCTYCYYLEKQKLYQKQTDFRMNDDLLERFIKQYIQSQQLPKVSFVWQGGEPSLMGLIFYHKVVDLQNKFAGGKQIENAFQTNGTKLNDEWCRFFRQHNFLVGISIDGPEEIHNRYRLYKNGAPSFTKVMKSIELLRKNQVEFNTLTVVHRYNALYPLEIYRFLKEIGSGFIQFLPVVERELTNEISGELKLVYPERQGIARVTEWSVIPDDYGRFLTSIFDEWVRRDVGQCYVQLFDVTLANWVGAIPGLCVFCETCGNDLVMEHNGDIYSCDHFVYPEFNLGNILNTSLVSMILSPEQYQFGMRKLEKLPKYCVDCEYRFACHGECPKHRFETTPDGECGLNYLCKAYKMFFSHVHPYMQYMGDELSKKRPPSNVMNFVKMMDDYQKQKTTLKKSIPGRNDPCPCGSGKKFKNCCM